MNFAFTSLKKISIFVIFSGFARGRIQNEFLHCVDSWIKKGSPDCATWIFDLNRSVKLHQTAVGSLAPSSGGGRVGARRPEHTIFSRFAKSYTTKEVH